MSDKNVFLAHVRETVGEDATGLFSLEREGGRWIIRRDYSWDHVADARADLMGLLEEALCQHFGVEMRDPNQEFESLNAIFHATPDDEHYGERREAYKKAQVLGAGLIAETLADIESALSKFAWKVRGIAAPANAAYASEREMRKECEESQRTNAA